MRTRAIGIKNIWRIFFLNNWKVSVKLIERFSYFARLKGLKRFEKENNFPEVLLIVISIVKLHSIFKEIYNNEIILFSTQKSSSCFDRDLRSKHAYNSSINDVISNLFKSSLIFRKFQLVNLLEMLRLIRTPNRSWVLKAWTLWRVVNRIWSRWEFVIIEQ